MTGHSFPAAPGRFLPLLLASLLWLGVAGPATGADGEVLTPSETPRALSGDGDEAFVVEGPFSLAWQNAGGRFAVEATAEGADKPAAASSTQGNGSGRLKLRGEQRYRVTIAADGPWTITLSR
ncbi:MAG TPA: hypothetical protein VIS03_10695 [Kiloniellaceae bacterium]